MAIECERVRKRVMYYYSNVESGETCVRASQAARRPRPAPLRSYVRRAVRVRTDDRRSL